LSLLTSDVLQRMSRNELAATLADLRRWTEVEEERIRRQEEGRKEDRVKKGERDAEWWLRHYMPHVFPSEFGVHHRRIIAEFEEMLTLSEVLRSQVGHHEVVQEPGRALPEAEGDDAPLTDAEMEALRKEEEAEAAFAAAWACPREHGKSSLMDGLVVRAVCYRTRRFVCFIGNIVDQAEEHVAAVKDELETNPRIRADFGDLAEGGTWQKREAITANGVRLKAYGTQSRMRGIRYGGGRPDLAVIDDAEDDEGVRTDMGRRKLWDWLTKVLLNALDSDVGIVVMVGTILHHDSMLARATGAEWLVRWRKAIYRALEVVDGHFHALWPERWPVKKLLAKRAEVGSIAFDSEYNNRAVSEASSPFKLEWIEAAKVRGRGLRFADSWDDVVVACGGKDPLILLSCWDFGWTDSKERAEEKDSNYTVGMLIAVNPRTRHRTLLRVWRNRGLTPGQVRVAVRDEAEPFRPPAESYTWQRFRVVVETVGLQKQLYGVGLREETDLPITYVFTDKSKRDPFKGVPRIGALLENGQYTLPWATGDDPEARRQRDLVQTVCNELWGLGSEPHDDTVMALWFGEVVIGKMLSAMDAAQRTAMPRGLSSLVRPDEDKPAVDGSNGAGGDDGKAADGGNGHGGGASGDAGNGNGGIRHEVGAPVAPGGNGKQGGNGKVHAGRVTDRRHRGIRFSW
jgi:hypothetical protein